MRTKEIAEKWSVKYKRSINCNNPKGFSQRAHCQGRKKNEDQQLDELKCWPGYQRVKGVAAGAPGSCRKKTQESSIAQGINEVTAASRRTAVAIAQELHQEVIDLGHALQGQTNSHHKQSLRQNIQELFGQLQSLGYEYDPSAVDYIRPLTIDI